LGVLTVGVPQLNVTSEIREWKGWRGGGGG
jgi:hypothetical protein